MSEAWQLGSRYRLERQVGSGAMGQVWAGHDVDGYPLAFKLLRPEFADQPGVVARFLQERNLLVSLRSPHVIRVHDLVVEGPRLAIVMDYVPGPSLRGLLQQRGNLTPAEVTSLGARMARGLAAVHGAGILHRDFKPENVLLADSHQGPQPKIADFGIASLAVTSSGHVGTAGVIGTPQYLAPELGDGQPSGRAGDLYAFGVTLYEMACGSVPFTADAPLALLRLHADYAPGRPDGIPDELWHLIATLLAKNPGERPDDAAQVAEALQQMTPRLAGLHTAPPLRTPPQPQRLDTASGGGGAGGGSDHRSVLVAAAIVVTLLAAGLLAWLLLAREDEASGARQPTPAGTMSVTAPTSTSTSRAPEPLIAHLAGGDVEHGRVSAGSRTYEDAIVLRRSAGHGCQGAFQVALDGRFSRVQVSGLLLSPQELASGDPVLVTPDVDGQARPAEQLSPQGPTAFDLDVRGARTLTFSVQQPGCDNALPSVAFADGRLLSN